MCRFARRHALDVLMGRGGWPSWTSRRWTSRSKRGELAATGGTHMKGTGHNAPCPAAGELARRARSGTKSRNIGPPVGQGAGARY
jgi:hypothetical protein